VFDSIQRQFIKAQLMAGQPNHAAGKRIIQELLKNKAIPLLEFISIVKDSKLTDRLLQSNIFSYNAATMIVTFHSRATEVFAAQNPQFQLDSSKVKSE
jgi:hypothetical protein